MKKLLKYSAAALAAILALACNKQVEVETVQPTAETLKFRAVLEQPVTKADLDNYAVVWQAGDQIAVYNGSTWAISDELTASEIQNNGRYAEFSVNIAEADNYWAVYPASAAPTAAITGDEIPVVLPAVQVIASGNSVAKDAVVQVSKTADRDNMVFQNVTSLIEFKAPASGIDYVCFEALDAEGVAMNIVGSASVDAGTPAAAVTGDASRVTVKGSFTSGESYFAVVYPQSAVSMFRFVFNKTSSEDGTSKAFRSGSTGSAFEFPLNSGCKFSDFGTLNWVGPIATKADLDRWAKYADWWTADETIKLGADIDYEGGTWEPVNGDEENGRFAGLFDGQNHSIYNIVISTASGNKNCGFFAKLASASQRTRAKDLILGFDPSTGKADVTSGLSGTQTSNTRLGAFAGLISKSNIENITNYIKVSATQDAAMQIGGLVGRAEETCYFTNCSNYATVDAKVANTGSVYVGGLFATVTGSNSKITSCTNYGTVQRSTATTKGNTFLSGIVGRVGENTNDVIISSCLNKGTIKHTVNVKNKQLYIGGITSMDNTITADGEYSVIITNCTNEGLLESTSLSTAATGMGVGGIIGYCKNAAKISGCTNLGTISKIKNHNGITSRFGGIIGWANSSKVLVENCINGSISDNTLGCINSLVEEKSDNSIEYYGGIIGALDAGTVRGCKNYATISTVSTETGIIEIAGGIAGQLSGGALENCENYGAVSVAAPHETCGAGGVIGVNNCSASNTTGTGCKVSGAFSCGYTANAGLVVGMYSGSATTYFGSSASPVAVSASSVNGTTIDATNFETYLAGTAAGITQSGVASGNNTIWASFQ